MRRQERRHRRRRASLAPSPAHAGDLDWISHLREEVDSEPLAAAGPAPAARQPTTGDVLDTVTRVGEDLRRSLEDVGDRVFGGEDRAVLRRVAGAVDDLTHRVEAMTVQLERMAGHQAAGPTPRPIRADVGATVATRLLALVDQAARGRSGRPGRRRERRAPVR